MKSKIRSAFAVVVLSVCFFCFADRAPAGSTKVIEIKQGKVLERRTGGNDAASTSSLKRKSKADDPKQEKLKGKKKNKNPKKLEEPKEVEDPFDFDDFPLDDYDDEFTASVGPIADPLKPWNSLWFHFNDKFYFWLLKPAAKGYGWVIPKKGRIGVKNVLDNLGFPMRFFNTAFQGKMKCATTELGRFTVNTTIGVLGLWDPGTKLFRWKSHDEDFDQTLGVWHCGKGVYLVWPLIGPCSVRGTFGAVADAALSPTTFLPGAGTLGQLNSISLGLFPYESIREMAVDPYVAVRDAYVQNRNKKMREACGNDSKEDD